MASIFSKIAAGEIPSYRVAENERYYAFLDINPVQPGHVLVIPKKETDYIFDIDDEELTGLHLFAKRVAIAIRSAIPCKKVAMIVLGLEVPHAHIHLIPMNSERDIDFKHKAELTDKEMTAVAAAIAKAYESGN